MNIMIEGLPTLKGEVKIVTTRSLRTNGLLKYLWHKYILGQKTGAVLRETAWMPNKIMFGTNTGYDLILKRLIGNNTYSLNILYADIGTDDTAPAITDTTLGNAVERSSNPVTSQNSNVISFQFFFADANLPDDTYEEFGTFVDGTATEDTGQIFNRILFADPYVKATGEDTTIQVNFTATSTS